MSRFDSPIIRLTTGFIDNINDANIGGIAAPSGVSRFAGQLGQGFWLDDSIVLWKSATPGYGGHFRYVKLSASATVPVRRGQVVFWDAITAPNTAGVYQVTTAENGSADLGMQMAGIVLNASWGVGNYSVIQDAGLCYVQFRTTLTAAGALGSRVFEAGAGPGADLGTGDVIDAGGAPTIANVSQMIGRFIGIAQEAPTNGGLKRVDLQIARLNR